MKKLTTFLFIVMFIIAGSVSVPRCYVLQPDCPERGAFVCSYAASSDQIVAESDSAGSCCHIAQNEEQQRQKKSVPSTVTVRFKIDQDRHIDDLNIEAPYEWSLQKDFYPPSHKIFTARPLLSRSFVHFHPPPLAILLQKQSFLI